MLSDEEVKRQSEGAMKLWSDTWERHAKENGEILKEKGLSNQLIYGHGLGRQAVCVGFASSLEDEVNKLKIKNGSVDILAVDKAMSYLLENGIKPNFVYIADAGIDYKKWCEPYLEQTEDICLISNVTANPQWTKNWRGKVFFYVNQDNIETQKIYAPLSGCDELIKASSNVGNSVIVHASTYLLYDAYFLLGYDFSWGWRDNYYCGEDSKKRWYMNHHQMINVEGDFVDTSQNLLFSARWLADFIKIVLDPQGKSIFRCMKKGLMNLPYRDIERVFKNSKQRELLQKELEHVIKMRLQTITIKAEDGERKLQEALRDNQIFDIKVRHLPKDLFEGVA